MQWWTLKQLKSSSAKARLAAAEKLGQDGEESLVEPLSQILGDADTAVRAAIAAALGRIKAESATGPLIDRSRPSRGARGRQRVEAQVPATEAGMPDVIDDAEDERPEQHDRDGLRLRPVAQ